MQIYVVDGYVASVQSSWIGRIHRDPLDDQLKKKNKEPRLSMTQFDRQCFISLTEGNCPIVPSVTRGKCTATEFAAKRPVCSTARSKRHVRRKRPVACRTARSRSPGRFPPSVPF